MWQVQGQLPESEMAYCITSTKKHSVTEVPGFCTTVPPFWTILVSMSFFVSSFHAVSTQNAFPCKKCDVTLTAELSIPRNCSPNRMGMWVSCLRFFFGDSDKWSLVSTCLEYSFPDASCKHQEWHVQKQGKLQREYQCYHHTCRSHTSQP